MLTTVQQLWFTITMKMVTIWKPLHLTSKLITDIQFHLFLYFIYYSSNKKPDAKRFVVYNHHNNGMFRTRSIGGEGLYVKISNLSLITTILLNIQKVTTFPLQIGSSTRITRHIRWGFPATIKPHRVIVSRNTINEMNSVYRY